MEARAVPRGRHVIVFVLVFLCFLQLYSFFLSLARSLSLLHILSTFTLPTRCKISSTFLYLLLDKTYKNAGKSIYREEESYSLRNVVFVSNLFFLV